MNRTVRTYVDLRDVRCFVTEIDGDEYGIGISASVDVNEGLLGHVALSMALAELNCQFGILEGDTSQDKIQKGIEILTPVQEAYLDAVKLAWESRRAQDEEAL